MKKEPNEIKLSNLVAVMREATYHVWSEKRKFAVAEFWLWDKSGEETTAIIPVTSIVGKLELGKRYELEITFREITKTNP